MAENFKPRIKHYSPDKMPVSLMELLRTGQGSGMSEYLSLSITGQGGQTRIRITTTDAHPVSYIAILPGAVMADLASLQFIAQSDDS